MAEKRFFQSEVSLDCFEAEYIGRYGEVSVTDQNGTVTDYPSIHHFWKHQFAIDCRDFSIRYSNEQTYLKSSIQAASEKHRLLTERLGQLQEVPQPVLS